MEKKNLPKLDWRSGHDPRSLNYRFFDLDRDLKPIQPKFWRPGVVIDQGREGACVGFGWTNEVTASPYPYTEKILGEATAFAHRIYQMARQHDRRLGWNWPEGASVLGGAKSIQSLGMINQFRWALSVEEVRAAIINEGPVVIGVNWYESMYDTRPSGLVEAKGRIVGGHCLTLIGYHPKMRINGEGWNNRWEVFKWVNSWGPDYGINGTGYITAEVLEFLLKSNGEACVPMQRRTIKSLR